MAYDFSGLGKRLQERQAKIQAVKNAHEVSPASAPGASGTVLNVFPAEKQEPPKVKMMPPGGMPATTTVYAHELGLPDHTHAMSSIRGSQDRPAEVSEQMAEVLRKNHGWVDHVEPERMTLEQTQEGVPERITMMAPDRSYGTAEAERGEGIPGGLYPCLPGEEIEVDPRDVDTLRAKGWGLVHHGRAFPVNAEPGARFKDESTGKYFVRSAAGWEPQQVFFDDDEAA